MRASVSVSVHGPSFEMENTHTECVCVCVCACVRVHVCVCVCGARFQDLYRVLCAHVNEKSLGAVQGEGEPSRMTTYVSKKLKQ